MIISKKGMSIWIWILIIIILIVLGVAAYFFLSSGSSLPKPPALPTG
jgi:flagellar basal body-associated protein FliL